MCRSHARASRQVRPVDYGAHVGGSRFLQVDPIEGGSANNYDYAEADPINHFDLNGQFCILGTVHYRDANGHKHSKCRGKGVARSVGRAAVSAGKATARAGAAVAGDFATCVTGAPCVIGDIANNIAVDGALAAAVVGGGALVVAGCNPAAALGTVGLSCAAGIAAGVPLVAAGSAGLWHFNRHGW